MIPEESLAALRRLMDARIKRDEDKVAADASEKAYREIEADVWEALSDGPMERLNNIDLGEPYGKVSFHAKETIYGKVYDKEAAHEYYEQRQMVEEISEPKFVMKRINEEVRDKYEQGEAMPPGVDFYPKRFVQITRKKD